MSTIVNAWLDFVGLVVGVMLWYDRLDWWTHEAIGSLVAGAGAFCYLGYRFWKYTREK